MSSSTPASKVRNLFSLTLRLIPSLVMVGFVFANHDFLDKPYSWTYLVILVGVGLFILFVPYREALSADLASIAMLALIQLALAYITDWSGTEPVFLVVLLKYGVPITTFIALVTLLIRLHLWFRLSDNFTIEEQNNYWAQRIGSAAGTFIALIIFIALSLWVFIGGPITELLEATLYSSVLMFGGVLVTSVVMDWAMRRALRTRWEERGFRASFEQLREFPEHIVKDVVEAQNELADLQARHFFLGFGLSMLIALVSQIWFSYNAIFILYGGMLIALVYMLFAIPRTRTKYRNTWHEAARLRVGETELLRQASLKSGLGWPEETNA